MVTRRAVIGGIGTAGVVTIAGCSDEGNEATSATGSSNEQNCRTVTETVSETMYDEMQTVSAGKTLTWNPDLETGDQLTVDVTELDGARPALEIEDAVGSVISDIEPSSNIRRTFTIDTDGRYYIQLENEAFVNSGQWDIVITLEREHEEEVCD